MYYWITGIVKSFFRIFILIFLLCHCADAQFNITGKVLDERTKGPLAFVNIVFNHNVLTGTTTDINGKFSYSTTTNIKTLTCSYVGYEKITLALDTARVNEPLIIQMRESNFQLREVVVKAGENPANRIIRRVIENKRINNPEHISSFKYTSYNKVIYDFDFSEAPGVDAGQEDLDKIFRGGHVMLMESVTERKFIYPDNNEEIILGTKVSGFKEATFAPLATDIQPFSFYKDIISILDVDYLNPISNGSLAKYDFRIEDTLYQGLDTMFILSFKPQQGKNFEGLTGLLYINTNQYAIQNVIAKPSESGFIDISLQQQYRFVDGKQWFPEQLKFELIIRQNSAMAVGVMASGVSIIRDVELFADVDKRDFALETIKMHELANRRDSFFWSDNRAISLNERDTITYQVLDSLGEKYNFDKKLKYLEKVGQNRLPVGFIDLDISALLLYNKFEGVRLGLGAYTNDKLMKHFSMGGFFGYGLKDYQWKYGGEAILTIDKQKELVLKARYQHTLLETGKSYLGFFKLRQFDFRTFLASQMDRIEQNSLAIGFRAVRYARVNLSFNHTRFDPQYTYAFQPDESDIITNYTITDVTLNLRYAYKEKLIESMGQRISMGTRYPVLSLSYTRGINDLFSSQFSYHKIEARIEKAVYIRNLGESKIRLDAGYIDTPLPYGLQFTGEGSFIRNWSVLVKNSFQTVTPYEFLSDRYISLYYAHNFGSLLFHIGNWRPTVTLAQNIGWGSLAHPEYHQYITFKTKDKGLYESGLQLDNLIKIKYLNVSYLGFGAGAYYRYGPYASGKVSDDLAFTFSMTFTTK